MEDLKALSLLCLRSVIRKN